MCATGEVDVAHVVGRVVVADLGVGPVAALDPDLLPGPDHHRDGHVRVPPVVPGNRLVTHRLGLVDAEHHIWHRRSSFVDTWSDQPGAGWAVVGVGVAAGAPGAVWRAVSGVQRSEHDDAADGQADRDRVLG